MQPVKCTVGHKSHDPCFQVFLMEAEVMTFVGHCTVWQQTGLEARTFVGKLVLYDSNSIRNGFSMRRVSSEQVRLLRRQTATSL